MCAALLEPGMAKVKQVDTTDKTTTGEQYYMPNTSFYRRTCLPTIFFCIKLKRLLVLFSLYSFISSALSGTQQSVSITVVIYCLVLLFVSNPSTGWSFSSDYLKFLCIIVHSAQSFKSLPTIVIPLDLKDKESSDNHPKLFIYFGYFELIEWLIPPF